MFLTYTILLVLAPIQAEPLQQHEERQVVSKLQAEEVWTNTRYEKTVLECLTFLKANPVPELAPILAKHIAYTTPQLAAGAASVATDVRYPVGPALKNIGIRAVPALIDRLKTVEPDSKPAGTTQEAALLVGCLVEILGQGGHGVELARLRIQLELPKSQGKEKPLLEKALQHPLLQAKK